MKNPTSSQRGAAMEALFGQICRATPVDARALSMMLNLSDRAALALFCYSRLHTREHGCAIASACTRESLFKAGGHAGNALYDQAEDKSGAWGAAVVFSKKRVSLAG